MRTEEKDILPASVSRWAASSFRNLLYQDAKARCSRLLQEAKKRCHLYFGRAEVFLPIHFPEISPTPGTPWPPILQCHVQLWVAGTTAYIDQRALEGGEGRGGQKSLFPFITRTVGLWTRLPLGQITNTQLIMKYCSIHPTPAFADC